MNFNFDTPFKEIIIDNPDDNLPIINTINDHRRGGGDRNRGTKVIKEVVTITDISLKVYWDNKQWVSVAEDLVIPDASIQTIAFFSDFDKIMSAKELIVHKLNTESNRYLINIGLVITQILNLLCLSLFFFFFFSKNSENKKVET